MEKLVRFSRICFVIAGAASILTSCLVEQKEHQGKKGAMNFLEKEGGELVAANVETGKQALQYQKDYDKNNHAIYFSKENIKELIDAAGTDYTGVRVYRTVKTVKSENGYYDIIGMVMVAVSKDGDNKNDITLANSKAILSYDRCPKDCDNAENMIFDSHSKPGE